jgi:hypothetical protein
MSVVLAYCSYRRVVFRGLYYNHIIQNDEISVRSGVMSSIRHNPVGCKRAVELDWDRFAFPHVFRVDLMPLMVDIGHRGDIRSSHVSHLDIPSSLT